MKKKPINIEADFFDFIKICNEVGVKYLVVGGYAVSIHGYPRSTKDMDVCIEMTEENATKMIAVLKEFGMASLGLTKEDFLIPHNSTQLGYEPVRIDILNDIDGVDFAVAWDNKKVVEMDGLKFNFIGYNELLKVKAKAGRPQDLADIDKLKKRNK